MKTKRAARSGKIENPAVSSQEETDFLLSEVSRLYRERFRAMYNGDQPALKSINDQIDALKSKLAKL